MAQGKYCVECGKEKRTAIFSNDPWCSENCRKSMKKEGPKVGLSQEWFDRNVADGTIREVTDFESWSKVVEANEA